MYLLFRWHSILEPSDFRHHAYFPLVREVHHRLICSKVFLMICTAAQRSL